MGGFPLSLLIPALSFPVIPALSSQVIRGYLPIIPALYPRHSRESGNPELANTIGVSRAHLVRIRIYWIIGFSGFFRRVFDRQALIRISLGGISDYGEKREMGETEILKIPPILQILILTKPQLGGNPLDSRFRGNDGVEVIHKTRDSSQAAGPSRAASCRW